MFSPHRMHSVHLCGLLRSVSMVCVFVSVLVILSAAKQ